MWGNSPLHAGHACGVQFLIQGAESKLPGFRLGPAGYQADAHMTGGGDRGSAWGGSLVEAWGDGGFTAESRVGKWGYEWVGACTLSSGHWRGIDCF